MMSQKAKRSGIIILTVLIGLFGVSVEQSLSEIVEERYDRDGNLWGLDCRYYDEYYDEYYDCEWIL